MFITEKKHEITLKVMVEKVINTAALPPHYLSKVLITQLITQHYFEKCCHLLHYSSVLLFETFRKHCHPKEFLNVFGSNEYYFGVGVMNTFEVMGPKNRISLENV